MSVKSFNIRGFGVCILLALLTIGPISTVVCAGEDGHTAVEFAFHDHCDLQHDDSKGETDGLSVTHQQLPHQHCLDAPIALDLIGSNNDDDPSFDTQHGQPIVFANVTTAAQTSNSALPLAAHCGFLPQYHRPLDAVILLL